MTIIVSSCAAPREKLVIICPSVQEYSEAEQDQAKKEYDNLKAKGLAPIIIRMIDDYGMLRIVIRVCKSEGQND